MRTTPSGIATDVRALQSRNASLPICVTFAPASSAGIVMLPTGHGEAAVENLPFGTGTGDCFDAMRDKYRSHGYLRDFEHNYNAHNQYLQALLTNGIPGIILLLLYYFVPVAESVRRRDILLLSLFILLALNSCFECLFDRRFGVDFFAIMIPLLMMSSIGQTQDQTNTQ